MALVCTHFLAYGLRLFSLGAPCPGRPVCIGLAGVAFGALSSRVVTGEDMTTTRASLRTAAADPASLCFLARQSRGEKAMIMLIARDPISTSN